MLGGLRRLTADAVLHELSGDVRAATTLDGLELLVDDIWGRYRRALLERARGIGGWLALLDAAQWTDRDEIMDLPEISESRRERLHASLDALNRFLGNYLIHYKSLKPSFDRALARGRRPIRHLDLASGHGRFALYVAERSRKNQLPLEVTGSDYFVGNVERAQKVAESRGVVASFRTVNAFDMSALENGSYDVLSCEGAIHHFSPGRVARLLREGYRVSTTSVVLIDGIREPWMVAVLPLLGALRTLDRDFVHDCWITARKFFHHEELRLIARAACPDAVIETTYRMPAFNVLTVSHPPS